MAIISFSMTVQPFMAGEKLATRRDWKENYTQQWQNWFDAGKILHNGYDKSPRNGGHFLAPIILTERPFLQPLREMTALDLIEEGNIVDTFNAFYKLVDKRPEDVVTVVKFRKVERAFACPTCNGQWVLSVDKTGIGGIDYKYYFNHLDGTGLKLDAENCSDYMFEIQAGGFITDTSDFSMCDYAGCARKLDERWQPKEGAKLCAEHADEFTNLIMSEDTPGIMKFFAQMHGAVERSIIEVNEHFFHTIHYAEM